MDVTHIEAFRAEFLILAILFALPLYILVLASLTFYIGTPLLAFFRRLVVPLFRRIFSSVILISTRFARCLMMLKRKAFPKRTSSGR